MPLVSPQSARYANEFIYILTKITSVIEEHIVCCKCSGMRGIMARKEMITIDKILDTAFAMTREEGFANVTARKVAAKAGCSTQPIFRVYKNMEELWDAVYERATAYFLDYYSLYPRTGKTPFANLGMAYIAFAREERHLFELLFVSDNQDGKHKKKSMYEILNGDAGNVVYEINLARIFIHGAACMSLTGDYDLTDLQTMQLLEHSYYAFYNETTRG